jgi:long-subunit fatty acid transport protein
MTTNSTFTEEVKSKSINSNPYLSNVYTSSVSTTGSGIGGKFGIIISPIEYFRFGLSYQTPIRVNLTDIYSSSNTTEFSTKSLSASTGDINSTYQIITPGKLTLSGVIMIPKHGFISADYEIIDYRDGQIKSTEFQSYFETVNTKARTILAQSTNMRIGGEYRWDNYRFRTGYNVNNSPYSGDRKITKQQAISAGLGMLWGNGYFMDAACIRSWGTVYNNPYDEKQSSQIDLTKYTFMLSGGIRF